MRRKRGSMMAILLMISTLIIMFAAVVGQNTLENMRHTHLDMDKGVARYAAFAGLQEAMAKLNEGKGTWEGEIVNQTLPSFPDILYSVRVDNGANSSITTSGYTLTTETALINAVASYKDGKVVKGLMGMEGMAIRDEPKFEQAILAGSMLAMKNGSRTMAFDFSKYTLSERDAQTTNTSAYFDPMMGNHVAGVVSQGLITMDTGSNTQVEGDVTKPNGNTTTAASAFTGALNGTAANGSTDLLKGVHYTGTEKKGSSKYVGPARPPYDPASATNVIADCAPVGTRTVTVSNGNGNGNGNGGTQTRQEPIWPTLNPGPFKSLTVNPGQQVQLSPGTYYFADDLKIYGDLICNGDVVIYVGKFMDVTGTVNWDKNPQTCQIYFTDEQNTNTTEYVDSGLGDGTFTATNVAANVSVLNMTGARATMVVRGKKLEANLKNSRLLGALVGSTVNMTGSKVEFDEGLRGRTFAMDANWKLQGVHETNQ